MKISKNFLARKLHQLTGIVPLGIYFLVHMFTNAKAMYGREVFEDAVADIHHIPFLLFIEVFGVFLPLLFHSVYGIIISAEARVNNASYNYGRNWFYLFQRITGVFLFLFLLFHILHLRFGLIPGLTDIAVAGNAYRSFGIVAGDFRSLGILIFYILGVAATAWHFGYGLWLFAVDWGIVIGEKAQKVALYICLLVALGAFFIGTQAAVSFIRPCGMLPEILCDSPKSVRRTAPQSF
ncbi:MAG: hypothetical protein R2747_19100 [Pyrinomonadaceae bacterium]